MLSEQIARREPVSSYQRKFDVAQYECHARASVAHGFPPKVRRPSRDGKVRKPKLVERTVDADGRRLPTKKESDFVKTIAGYIRFSLPDNFCDHLWFVRAFLNAFAYGHRRNSTPKSEVKRRCSIAVDFAFERRSYRELANKLGIRIEVAEVLLEYGHQRIPKNWLRMDDRVADRDSHNDEAYSAKPESPADDWFVADADDSDFDTIMNAFRETHDADADDEPDQSTSQLEAIHS